MKPLVALLLGFFLGFFFGTIIVISETDHDILHRVGCWLDKLKKSRSGDVYIVRKSHTDLYLKEDYSYSKLGESLAPLLFYSVDSARQTMELLEWENSKWVVMETSKDILSNVIGWSRSEKPKKENFHKFGHSIDFDQIEIEPITRRCANCNNSERGEYLWYCFETGRFMSPNGCCSYWKGEENATK